MLAMPFLFVRGNMARREMIDPSQQKSMRAITSAGSRAEMGERANLIDSPENICK